MGLDALAAMHDRDRELGVDPTAIVRTPDPPAPPLAQPLIIPPWDTSSVVQPPREPDPPLVTEDTETKPAKPRPSKPKAAATPNLDRWRKLLHGDRGDAA
jgi:hypothetical protein